MGSMLRAFGSSRPVLSASSGAELASAGAAPTIGESKIEQVKIEQVKKNPGSPFGRCIQSSIAVLFQAIAPAIDASILTPAHEDEVVILGPEVSFLIISPPSNEHNHYQLDS
jgi:hypothetical protein